METLLILTCISLLCICLQCNIGAPIEVGQLLLSVHLDLKCQTVSSMFSQVAFGSCEDKIVVQVCQKCKDTYTDITDTKREVRHHSIQCTNEQVEAIYNNI